MPIGFLTDAERDRLNRFPTDIAPTDLLAYFTLSETLEHPISPAERAVLERWLATARGSLGEDAAARASKTGQELSTEQAIQHAHALERESFSASSHIMP